MARLLRGTAYYTLRKPVVLGPVAPAFSARPLQVVKAPRRNDERQRPHSRLAAPVVVAPSVTFRPVAVSCVATKTVGTDLVRRRPHYRLSPPITSVVPAAVSPRLRTTLAKQRAPRRVTSLLRPTLALAAPTAFLAAPVRLALARRRPQPRTITSLRAPTVVSPPAVFVARPLSVSTRVAVARPTERHPAASRVPKPAVVAPAIVFAPVRRTLASQLPLFLARKAKSRLGTPTIMGDVVVVAPSPHSCRPILTPAVDLRSTLTITALARSALAPCGSPYDIAVYDLSTYDATCDRDALTSAPTSRSSLAPSSTARGSLTEVVC